MTDNSDSIGGRLREEITRVYGSYKKAASVMGVKSGSYFRPYLNNTSGIGIMLQKKLSDIGLDVEYIMTGKRKAAPLQSRNATDEIRRKLNDMKYRIDQLSQDYHDLLGMFMEPDGE
ncbi:MAG: hypothetical protein WCG19_04460 [Chlorobiaceae bacterium]